MSKIDDLIEKLCPNGVEYKPIWSLTAWDKKFNGVDKEKQKNVISYKYYLSTDFAKVEKKNGNIKYISTGIYGDDRYTTEELAGDYLAEGEVVCIPWGGTPNVKYHKGKFVTGDNRIATSLDINILSNKFLYYWMQSKINVISKFYRGSGIKHPSMKDVLDMNIAVPPLEVQCEIVHILDDFTLLSAELSAELKARRKQYEYYKEKLFNLESKEKKLKDVAQIYDSLHATPKYVKQGYPMIRVADVKFGIVNSREALKVNEDTFKRFTSKYEPQKEDIIISRVGSFGNVCIVGEEKICLGQNTSIIHPLINKKYLYFYLASEKVQSWIKANVNGAGYKSLTLANINEIPIKVPSDKQQEEIANILDRFEKLCNDISEGLPAEIEARQKQYEYYRDKLLTFKELKVNE